MRCALVVVVVVGSCENVRGVPRDCRSRSFTPIQTLSEAKDSVSSVYVSSEEIIASYSIATLAV
jgi:hypothetical protein